MLDPSGDLLIKFIEAASERGVGWGKLWQYGSESGAEDAAIRFGCRTTGFAGRGALPDALNGWLGRESAGEPVQIATDTADLSAELNRGLVFVRKQRRGRTSKKRAA